MRKAFDILKIILFAGAFVVIIHYFLLEPYYVPDNTMSPTLRSGAVIIVSRIPYFIESYKRGDMIIFRTPKDYSNKVARKIIGVPGERVQIEGGAITIKSPKNSFVKEIPIFGDAFEAIIDPGKLDAHEYYVIGESALEKDSGLIDKRFIVGRPFLRIWPYNRIGFL